MPKLLITISLLLLTITLFGQSPHGDSLTMDCKACHTSDSWLIADSSWVYKPPVELKKSEMTGWLLDIYKTQFNHANTDFTLEGGHSNVDCRACHASLIFEEANTDCISCHTDMHSQTVGNDCKRCHTVTTWLVDDIPELHEENGFPLIGSHDNLSCVDCHISETNLRFDPIGNDCINCHLTTFQNTQSPDHEALGFSTNCIECHNPLDEGWDTDVINHDFFPLTLGHDIQDCLQCHTADNYSDISADCISCHQTDFENTVSPNHEAGNFTTDCIACHTTDPGWQPAVFATHDEEFFPIYSGSHEGVWSDCVECHTNPSNFAEFTCISCHINPETDDIHVSVNGYVYEDNACLACHPTGNADDVFDHNTTNFPLTGEHIGVDCLQCHADGFAGTPTDCASCHTDNYNASTNPNHSELNFPMDCATCHTTDPDWMPATFAIHDDYYQLNGAHALIANDCAICHNGDYNNTPNTCVGCHLDDFNSVTEPNHNDANFSTDCTQCHGEEAWLPSSFDHNSFYPLNGAHELIANDCNACHNGNYTNTPNTCVGCHQDDFNNTTDPNHIQTQFSTDCTQCHNEQAWTPSSFDHDGQYFPIYSGEHEGEWSACTDCHINPNNFAEFSCTVCHTNPETDYEHIGVGGYIYESNACLACHPTGSEDDDFNHNNTAFSLTGEHIGVNCLECHGNGFVGTSTECASCHTPNYNASTNPNHTALNFSTDCATCHTTDPDWVPATFAIHDDYYPLNGAHALIANDCATCHNGDYNNTPNTCVGCHLDDFNSVTEPNHNDANFSTDCTQCHGEEAWLPSSFDHNSFYPLNGAHELIANDCNACHNGNYTNTPNTCVGCHQDDFNNTTDPNHIQTQFSTDCTQCHNEEAWEPSTFDHDGQYFPIYSGEHEGEWNACTDCHTNPNNFAEFSCTTCHTNPETDNDHNGVGGYVYESTACLACHPTGDSDDNFDHNNTAFPLTGEHVGVDCLQCHADGFAGTSTDCASCHTPNYNASTNPNHNELNFPMDCAACHTTDPDWMPATFAIHDDYYPLNGAHALIANECATCHNGDYNNTPNTCVGCHLDDFNNVTEPNHNDANFSTDCTQCHNEDTWVPSSFDHNSFYPLNGAHELIANDCNACHNGNYTNTPNTCVGCHQENYDNTTDPNHAAAQFSTDCTICHNEEAWEPSSFDHDGQYFPIYSGEHEGEWSACIDCHTNPNNFAEFSCTTCHTNPETDNDHNGVGGYVYESTACLACHPTGSSEDNFNHNNTAFPLTGEHIGVDCLQCHADGFVGTSTNCASCHTDNYNASTNPNHSELNFPMDCATCHTTDPDWMPATFATHDDYYQLNGAHALIANECATCHNGDYNNTPNTCVGCHLDDFNNVVEPNHTDANFSTDCTQCHGEDAWLPSSFDHNSFYPLNGAHELIANDCNACHNGSYTNTPNTCVGCHQDNYDNTSNPNHAAVQFSSDCIQCHNEEAWQPSTFDHDGQYFPIYSGEHEGEWNACIDCHTNPNNFAEFTCTTCHANPETDNDHSGVGGYIYESTACLACHPTGSSEDNFDHNNTAFPLTGEHIGVDCLQCHADGFVGTSTDCASCHTDNYNASTNPNHNELNFPMDCATCHTTDPDWMPATFATHDDYYQLNGAHALIANECATCHNGDYNNTPNTCVGCHLNDYNETISPNHAAAQFPTNCEQCHGEDSWTPSSFNHDDFYPLTGEHLTIADDCNACHNGNYTNTPNTCVECHINNYNASVNPNHQNLNIPTACETCHTTAPDWMPATFDIHNDYYQLNGAHALIANECASCHNGDYNNTPNTCLGCHLDDYNATTNPSHVAAQFPTDCEQCHGEDAWTPSSFNHNDFYVIEGAHIAIADDCLACHNGDYSNTPNTCVGCHLDDFNNTSNPNHTDAQFPTDCEQCHTQEAWVPSSFNHDDFYPLTGEHLTIADDCNACHNGNYTNTPNTCVECHIDNYNASVNPDHQNLNFPTACETCHTTDLDWMPATFDIHNDYYQLNGAHALIANDCATCHNGDYNNTPNTCVGCHLDNFNNTSNPNHAAAQFPTDCEQCHGEDAWTPTSFNHDDFYPLTGEHLTIADDCNACHNGNYTNTPNTCVECHIDNYNASVNPNHQNLNIPTACETCHTTDPDWMPATFDIHNDYYQLNGAHALIANDCATCHNGDYNNTSNTCVGCHLDDFNATSNPNHVAAQFPTDCEQCHGEDAWTPTSFNHNDFYVIEGAHIAIADDCVACHNGDYSNTPNTCVGCHLDDFNNTSNPNHTDAQFPTDCEQCHTQETWIPSSFNHDDFYPLTGEHLTIADDCNACHNGNYTNTPNTCVECHIDNYNASVNPDHQNLNIPTACETCHTTDPDWMPATFDIHNDYYQLNGAHALIANDCATCHNGDYNNTPNTCVGCHLDDFNNTSNPNHAAAQFPTDCEQCHGEDAWTPTSFNHDDFYPLTGEHLTIADDCNACHNGNYTNTPNTCVECHIDNYNASVNPNHQNLNIPTACETCHTTDPDWMPATFDIHNDYYQLNGAHALIANDCASCHNGDYNNTPNTCVGCHLDDYNATSNPNHAGANFSTDCTTCHTETAWSPSTFDHDSFYPLLGAHADISTDCNACHNGDYNNTPNTCVGCHLDDYNGTTDPNHSVAQFPTDCEQCHSQTAWEPSTFDHDNMYFPIYSGEHEGEWNQCSECHTTPNDYSLFSCIDCHEHNNPTDLADDHDGVNGYIYESTACYACHPNGEE